MLLCPNTKHPAELWWSPKASQGLQVPHSTPFMCHPTEIHQAFPPALATSNPEMPSPSPPTQKGSSIFAFAISKGGHSPIPEVLSASLVVPK